MISWVAQKKCESDLRTNFQICINDDTRTYIGWCGSYNVNEDFEITQNKGNCAIGIDIPAVTSRDKGFATSALVLLIHYFVKNEINEIYTQTWSGNKGMISLANKLGFEECIRKLNHRKVRGELYDSLTFKLNMEKFDKGFNAEYENEC